MHTLRRETRLCDVWFIVLVDSRLDYVLLSSSQRNLHKKTNELGHIAGQTRLRISSKNTKIMMVNANNSQPITTGDQEVKIVDSFTYLGAIIDVDKGT